MKTLVNSALSRLFHPKPPKDSKSLTQSRDSSDCIQTIGSGSSALCIQSKYNPNFSNRSIVHRYILLHCIGYEDPLAVLNESGVSAHYFIPVQNHTGLVAYQLVDPELRAWHAGVSAWKNDTGLNDWAIGIEVNMLNYAKALENTTLDWFYFEQFQSAQISALKQLVQYLMTHYEIPPQNVLSHSDVSPFRFDEDGTVILGKTDIGPTLPWEFLAEEGIGVFPVADAKDDTPPCLTAECAQKLLLDVGYFVAQTGVFDAETNMTIRASKLHFTPECYGSPEGCTTTYDPKIAIALDNVASGRWVTRRQDYDSSLALTLGLVFGGLLAAFVMFAGLKACKKSSKPESKGCLSRWFGSRRSDEKLPLLERADGSHALPTYSCAHKYSGTVCSNQYLGLKGIMPATNPICPPLLYISNSTFAVSSSC
jgi:N-acetylmuramoyl-L-alanine amidase